MYADDIVKELYEYAVKTGKNSDLYINLYDGNEIDFEFHSTTRGQVYIIPSKTLALQSEVDELDGQIESLNEKISQLQSALESEQQEVVMLEEENSALSSELASLRAQLLQYE